MAVSQQLQTLVGLAGLGGALTTYPYVSTAIGYRNRDNGLAYLLMLMGIGIWNGMLAVQVIDSRFLIDQFFYALSILGALIAGLGWFLFASTASSTRDIPHSGPVYGVVSILVGLDIVLALTAPVHDVYWADPALIPAVSGFAVVSPRLGYWLHTAFLAGLFGVGTLLFVDAWMDGKGDQYVRAYSVLGIVTVVAILASNILAPGGLTVAPFVAVGLNTVIWVQARRGEVGIPWL